MSALLLVIIVVPHVHCEN